MAIKIKKFGNGGAVNLSDDIIDPDEVMFGDDGKMDAAEKDDTPEPEKLGSEPSETPAEKPEAKPDKNRGDAGKPAGEKEAEDAEAGENDGEEAPEPVNHADYVLKSLGFQTTQIDLGDGVVKDVADLTEQEQLDVVTSRMEEVVSFYEKQLEEINNNGSFSNDIERIVVETLRGSEYDLSELVKVISANDPAVLAKTASNEELVRNHLKTVYPEFSEEDITEEMEGMAGTSRFERLASKLRETMSGRSMTDSELAKAIDSYRTSHNERLAADFAKDRDGLSAYAKEIKEFNKIPLSDEVKEFVLKDIVSNSPQEDSPFIASINTPDKLFRLSFLDKFHEQLVENTAKHYFELGKQEAEKIAGKFRDTPEVIMGGNGFRSKPKANKQPVRQEEEF